MVQLLADAGGSSILTACAWEFVRAASLTQNARERDLLLQRAGG